MADLGETSGLRRGCFKFEDIEACERAGMTPYVPKPQRGAAVREGFFAKDEFRYDPDEDVCICPAGERLVAQIREQVAGPGPVTTPDDPRHAYDANRACAQTKFLHGLDQLRGSYP